MCLGLESDLLLQLDALVPGVSSRLVNARKLGKKENKGKPEYMIGLVASIEEKSQKGKVERKSLSRAV